METTGDLAYRKFCGQHGIDGLQNNIAGLKHRHRELCNFSQKIRDVGLSGVSDALGGTINALHGHIDALELIVKDLESTQPAER